MSPFEHILFAYIAVWARSCPYFNLLTLQSPWNVALYESFKLKSLCNLYYVQYFMGTLAC